MSFYLLPFLFFVALLLIFLTRRRPKNACNLPKGPSGLSIFGNILQILKNPQSQLSKWAEQYGKVYTIHIGSKPVLIINDVKTMKQIFGLLESTGTFESEIFELIYEGKWGIVNAEGNARLEQHSFCVKVIKEMGIGNSSRLDPVILGETDDLCEWIDNKLKTGPDTPLKFKNILMQATSNTMWNIFTGERIKSEESKMVTVLQNWVNALNVATKSGFVILPWLRYIIPERSGYNSYSKACKELQNLTRKYFQNEQGRRALSRSTATDNVVGRFLDQMENCKDQESSFFGENGKKHSFCSVIALMLGASETTASVLNWTIFYLALNPEVQTRLQTEIDEKVGSDRDPAITDRQRMPYTDAVIMETLRYCSLLPFGIIQKLLEDVTFEGYTLPKGMLLFPDIYHANHNPAVWKDPEIFQPERFLIEDEAERRKVRDCVATFQEGKRKCPGEQMAKDTLFLFTVKLFQKYSFYPEKGRVVREYMKPMQGWICVPPDLGIVVRPRSK